MDNIRLIGIDTAKNVFQFACANHAGKVVLKKRIWREALMCFMSKLPREAVIVMEACGGSHHWGRTFQKLGFKVKLIAPQLVSPYRKSQKSDAADAVAIVEAARSHEMRFVDIKTEQQQEIQFLHRIRQRLMSNRTALINQMRGMLTEFGLVMPKGVNYVLKSLSTALEQRREQIPGGVLDQIEELRAELASLEREIAKFERKIERYAKITPIIKRLMEVLGVGPLTATALFVICTNPANYKNGRCFSASLGLVPWHNNSGEHHWIGHITKRGDTYARMLLIHGARAALCSPKLKNRHDPHSLWMKSLIERKGMNRAAVALANKNARIIWALMAKNDEFRLPQAA